MLFNNTYDPLKTSYQKVQIIILINMNLGCIIPTIDIGANKIKP